MCVFLLILNKAQGTRGLILNERKTHHIIHFLFLFLLCAFLFLWRANKSEKKAQREREKRNEGKVKRKKWNEKNHALHLSSFLSLVSLHSFPSPTLQTNQSWHLLTHQSQSLFCVLLLQLKPKTNGVRWMRALVVSEQKEHSTRTHADSRRVRNGGVGFTLFHALFLFISFACK